MIDASFMKNMVKAADAGMDHYVAPAQWHAAIEAVAAAKREQGESIEQAFARVTLEDPVCRQFSAMYKAAMAKGDNRSMGRPRKYKPEPAALSAAQNELARRSLDLAKVEGISFERAFVKVIDTPEGAAMFRETRQ